MDFDQLHVRRGIRLAAGLLVAMGLTLIPAAVRAQTADSASAPAFTDEISEPPAADWSRIDDAAPDSAGQVLELPQVVAADETADDSAATTMD
ncbi:MAG: hypothetical protein ACREQC_10620, partial [Candidatus Binataceae bacterium]